LALLIGAAFLFRQALHGEAYRRRWYLFLLRLPMHSTVDEINKKDHEGGSMSRAIASTGMFPPVMTQLVASGEKSGRLPEMLDRIASQQTQELDTRVLSMTALLEPLLILVMGGVVLLIVLAILMPIFEMNQMVR
jgi:general secretion pathway protein F